MHSTQISAYQGRPAQSVSAGWVNSYDQPSRAEQFPEHFFDSEINLRNVCPETALLYAVLEDAFFCFQKQFEVRMRPIQRQAAREAEEWFFSDDSRELFSFKSVCTALGLEPEFIRKKLKQRRQAAWTRRRERYRIIAKSDPRRYSPPSKE
jgi:hypothetical protein